MDFGAAQGVVCTTFALVGRSLTLGLMVREYERGGVQGALGDSTMDADVGCSAGLTNTGTVGAGARGPPPQVCLAVGAVSHPGTPNPGPSPPGVGAR